MERNSGYSLFSVSIVLTEAGLAASPGAEPASEPACRAACSEASGRALTLHACCRAGSGLHQLAVPVHCHAARPGATGVGVAGNPPPPPRHACLAEHSACVPSQGPARQTRLSLHCVWMHQSRPVPGPAQ